MVQSGDEIIYFSGQSDESIIFHHKASVRMKWQHLNFCSFLLEIETITAQKQISDNSYVFC